jgi:outer membrane receptor protein involved in Fe transport
MNRKNIIRRAVRFALATSAIATAMSAGTAAAQDAAEMGAVVVTGTRIQRQDYTATSPVVTIAADTLQQAGTVQIDTVLNQLPQLVPSISTSSNNPSATGGAGQALVDMRGLGATRTLVLLDGTRLTPSHPNGQIDLNTIPASLIENIEILTGGASSVYGSDAIAGVINLKLMRDFEGVQIDTQYGQTDESDGQTIAVDVTMGGNFDNGRGNAVLAISYDDRERILAGDRPFGQFTFGPNLLPQGSATIPEGRYDRTLTNLPTQAAMDAVFAGYGVAAGTVLADDFLGFNSDGTLFDITGAANYRGEEFVGFNPASFTYNFAPVNYLQLPLERRQIFASGNYSLMDGDASSVEAYARLLYTTYEAEQQLAPTPITGLSIPVTNPNIPADLATLLASRANPNAPFLFRVRTVAAGPRIGTPNFDVTQALMGFRGEFQAAGREWNWDVYGSWGRTEVTERQQGNISFSRIQGLLNGDDLGTCAAADFDPFGLGNMTPACAQAISIGATNVTRVEQENLQAVLSGELFGMPAGPFQAAFGAGYGRNDAAFIPDEFLASGDVVGFNAQPPQEGSIDVKEAFVEFAIPLLKDLPAVNRLELELGYRYSEYNLAGSFDTYKGALNWEPMEALKFRTSYNRATRAPSIEELFLPPQENFPGYNDPCEFDSAHRTGGVAGVDPAQVATLCQAQGIPAAALATFQQPNAQVRSIQGGNVNLSPESADTITFGFVWQPDFENALRASVDYWSYELEDVIGAVSANSAISRCFNDVGANPTYDPNNFWCQLFTRTPSGEATDVLENNQNLSALEADGIDFQVDFGIPVPERYGRVAVNLLVTHLLSWDAQEDAVSPFGSFEGTITTDVAEAFPKWKGVLNVGWEIGNFEFNWNARYIDGMTVVNDDALGTPVTAGLLPSVPSFDYHRLTAGWSPVEKLDLMLGIDNLFDKDPPIYTDNATAGQQANTDPSTYDILGRRYFMNLTYRF